MLLVYFLLQANCSDLLTKLVDIPSNLQELIVGTNMQNALQGIFLLYQDMRDHDASNWYIISRKVVDLKRLIYRFLLRFNLFDESNRGKPLSYFIKQFDAIAQQYGGESLFKIVNFVEYLSLYNRGFVLVPLLGDTLDELHREIEKNFGRYFYLEDTLLHRGFISESSYLKKVQVKGKVSQVLSEYLTIFFKGEQVEEEKITSFSGQVRNSQIREKLDELIYPFLAQVRPGEDGKQIEVEENISLYTLINFRESVQFCLTMFRSSVARFMQEHSLNKSKTAVLPERSDNLGHEEINNIFSLIKDMQNMSAAQREELITFLTDKKDFYTQLIANIYQKNKAPRKAKNLLDGQYSADGKLTKEVDQSFRQGKFIFELFYLYNMALISAQLDESKNEQIWANFLESYLPLSFDTNVTQYRKESFNFNSFLYEILVARLHEFIYAKPAQRSSLEESLQRIDRDLREIVFNIFAHNREKLAANPSGEFFLRHSFDLLSGEVSPQGMKGSLLSNLLQMNLFAQRLMAGDDLIVPSDFKQTRKVPSFFAEELSFLPSHLVLTGLLEYFFQARPLDVRYFPYLPQEQKK